jgi:hypothetical protein
MMHAQVVCDSDLIVSYQLHPEAPRNGLLILYGIDVAFVPPEQRGRPRTDYARTYCVIPQDASEERAVEIFRQNWCQAKRTCGGSFDDAGVGDLSDRTAVLYDVPESRHLAMLAWYEVYYPSVKVVFA